MDYPSNSHKKNQPVKKAPPKKDIQKVVTGEVIIRKKSLGKRFLEVFGGGDAKSVFRYIVFDVLIPSTKETIVDASTQAIERMFFGEARSRTGRRRTGGVVNYAKPSAVSMLRQRREEPRETIQPRNGVAAFEDIVLATKIEAEEVIERMADLMDRYQSVSVADLYELLGITGPYTNDRWGWMDLEGVQAVQIRGGWLLDLPEPEAFEF